MENTDLIFPYLLSMPLDKIETTYLFEQIELIEMNRFMKLTENSNFTPIRVRSSTPKNSIIRKLWSKLRTPSKSNKEPSPSRLKSPTFHRSNRLSPIGRSVVQKQRSLMQSPSPSKNMLSTNTDSDEVISLSKSFKEFTMRTPSKDALFMTPIAEGKVRRDKSITKSNSKKRVVLSPIELVEM